MTTLRSMNKSKNVENIADIEHVEEVEEVEDVEEVEEVEDVEEDNVEEDNVEEDNVEEVEEVDLADVEDVVENNNTTKIVSIGRECWSISKLYLFWIIVHIISTNLYCYFCAHLSIYGLFVSPFVTVAPHCKALGWLMTNSATAISNMWLTFGVWLVSKIPIVNRC